MNKSKMIGWLGIVAGVISLLSVILLTEYMEKSRPWGVRYLLIIIGISLLAAGVQYLRRKS